MQGSPASVRVWDLPTRLFHWLLATLVVFSFASAKIGGAWIEWHFRSGYTILALLLFRLLWGCAGNRHARFSSFLLGPRAVASHLAGRGSPGDGHSPLGGWSVIAMLAALLVQAGTGLFANDAIFNEGPLARFVSSTVSDRLSAIHRWGEKTLIALVTLHVSAVGYYLIVHRRNLIAPMISGDRPGAGVQARDDTILRLRALLLAALAAGLVAYVVTL
jgi:cytochrome b